MKTKRIITKTLKILAWVVGSMVVIAGLALWAVVWFISPENLTKIAENAANEYLDADVKIGRIELTAYSTFPIIHVDIDSLSVASNSLDSIEKLDKSRIPSNASSLASFSKLHLGVNLLNAMIGKITVEDLSVNDLWVNLVDVSPTVSNYAIVPASGDEKEITESDTTSFQFPDILCREIMLNGKTTFSYCNATDSSFAQVTLTKASFHDNGKDLMQLDIAGNVLYATDGDTTSLAKIDISKFRIANDKADSYRLELAGDIDYKINDEILANGLPFDMSTAIHWNPKAMANISISDFKATIIDIPIEGNLLLLAQRAPRLQKFDLSVGPVKFASIVPHLPAAYRKMFRNISSNIMATVNMNLDEPYMLLSKKLPSMSAQIVIPDSYWRKNGATRGIDRIALRARMQLYTQKPNASTVTLDTLILNGKSIKLQLSGVASNLFADPHVSANVSGYTDIGTLTKLADIPLNFSITGEASANASVDMHMSDLNKNNFHKMKLYGSLGLSNIHYDNVLDTMSIYANNANLTFGNKQSFMRRDSSTVDDLLKVTVHVDTLDASVPGLDISMKNSTIGAGAVGASNLLQDTTQVVPMGIRFTSSMARMRQDNGTFIATRGITCSGNVMRYRNIKRMPLYHLGFGIDTIFYRDNASFIFLNKGRIDLFANRRVNWRRVGRTKQLIDTLRARHPEWSNDTLLAYVKEMQDKRREALRNYAHSRNRQDMQPSDEEIMNLGVDDSGFRKLLSRWQLTGFIKSETGALYTPYFPLRNKITDVDVAFNMDSITVRNFNYNVGSSNFNLKGQLKNIRSNLMGRTRRPLDISMILKADTIDVNQLIKAAADGMTYSNNAVGLNTLGSEEELLSVESMEQQVMTETATADSAMAAFVVPRNIEAKVALRSNNITFADMDLKQFNGNLLIHDGVINLNELRALSNLGSARFNAMYASTDRHNIKFGFDLGMKKIHVGQLLKMIPAIDSVMPLLESVDGIIDADIATTSNIDSTMNLIIPTLKAAIKLHGDSLVFMDSETFRQIAKMLRFKNKEKNMIDSMTVELLVENSQMQLFPFMFNFDRYKLGVLGYNDLNLNFKYHISVLDSPIPFKFGINIYGNPDDMHFRFGGAKYKDGMAGELVQIVDTTRINLREQINAAFRRGARAALRSELRVNRRPDIRKEMSENENDTLSSSDSLKLIQEGMIEKPQTAPTSIPAPDTSNADIDENKNDSSEIIGIKPEQAILHDPKDKSQA